MENEAGFAASEQFHPAYPSPHQATALSLSVLKGPSAVQSLPSYIFDGHGGDGKCVTSLEPSAQPPAWLTLLHPLPQFSFLLC